MCTVDTYRSRDHADDPPTPHVSLHSPLRAHHGYSLACSKVGSVPVLCGSSVDFKATGEGERVEGWELEVIYDANRRRVWAGLSRNGNDVGLAGPGSGKDGIDTAEKVEGGVDSVLEEECKRRGLWEVDLPLPSIAGALGVSEWVIGVTASCGGLWQTVSFSKNHYHY